MEDNKNFIKGGLPLNSGDFVDSSKAQENKSKLLAALDNINKIHEKKMKVETATNAIQNFDAVGITLDMLDKENANTVKPTKPEYILDSQIVRDPVPPITPAPAPAPQPLFNNDDSLPNNDFPIEYKEVTEDMTQDEVETVFGPNDPGEPMIVLDDSQVGKRSKKTGKDNQKGNVSTPDQVKSGRGVAWMAYIIFFLPLIFNGKNPFVRHHANEGLELNIIDIIGVGLFLANKFVKISNEYAQLALMIGSIIGLVLVAITTITKLFLIIFALAGKEAQSPFFGKAKMIK